MLSNLVCVTASSFKTVILIRRCFFLNSSWIDYIIEKEPLVNKFISVPSDGGRVADVLDCNLHIE